MKYILSNECNMQKNMIVKSSCVISFAIIISLLGGIINLRLSVCRLEDKNILIECIRSMNIGGLYHNESFFLELFDIETGPDNVGIIKGVNNNNVGKLADNVLFCSINNDNNVNDINNVNSVRCAPALFRYIIPDKYYEKCYNIYKAIISDVRCFPVASDVNKGIGVSYDNSWGNDRSYGGGRKHEGTDIMSDNNISGYFPVVSMTDGVVEKKGWLELGGYRLGVRSNSGAYYYYAHLAEYADGIEEGVQIKAGTVIGTMGDTGYGKEEGTSGKFPVHLHLGIYYGVDGEEMAFNPYFILKEIESCKREFI